MPNLNILIPVAFQEALSGSASNTHPKHSKVTIAAAAFLLNPRQLI
jgi:hypothetical protein